MHGHGLINWWGFSPGFDPTEYIDLKHINPSKRSNLELSQKLDAAFPVDGSAPDDIVTEKNCFSNNVPNKPGHECKKNVAVEDAFKAANNRSSSEQDSIEDRAHPGVSLVLIGAGDPRLVLHALSSRAKRNNCLTLYVLESCPELYGRLLLLLHLSLGLRLELFSRTDVVLDVWANLHLRPNSCALLAAAATCLQGKVTDRAQYGALLGFVSASHLLHRDRDAIDTFLGHCRAQHHQRRDPVSYWDQRLRQLWGSRFEHRRHEAEWAWHLRLKQRLTVEQMTIGYSEFDVDGQEVFENSIDSATNSVLCHDARDRLEDCASERKYNQNGSSTRAGNVNNKKYNSYPDKVDKEKKAATVCGETQNKPRSGGETECRRSQIHVCGGWGEEYLRWREGGLCFDLSSPGKEEELLVPNASLFSSHGPPDQQRGYWGSVLCGPHAPLSVITYAGEMAGRVNGAWNKSGTEVARENMLTLLEGVRQDRSAAPDREGDVCSLPREMQLKCQIKTKNKRSVTSPATSLATSSTTILATLPATSPTTSLTTSPANSPATAPTTSPATSPVPSPATSEEEESSFYCRVSNVRLVLLSPKRLKKLDWIPEVPTPVEGVYLSAGCAHLLTPTLLKGHIAPHTLLWVEDALLFPELTEAQVQQCRQRVQAASQRGGWSPKHHCCPPLLHHCFRRGGGGLGEVIPTLGKVSGLTEREQIL